MSTPTQLTTREMIDNLERADRLIMDAIQLIMPVLEQEPSHQYTHAVLRSLEGIIGARPGFLGRNLDGWIMAMWSRLEEEEED